MSLRAKKIMFNGSERDETLKCIDINYVNFKFEASAETEIFSSYILWFLN
jgi:hypothetical protein